MNVCCCGKVAGYPLLMSAKVKARGGTTTVSSKHQITLPVAALRAAHLQPGDRLAVTVDGIGRLTLSAVEAPLDALFGAAPGISGSTDLQALRDEWDR